MLFLNYVVLDMYDKLWQSVSLLSDNLKIMDLNNYILAQLRSNVMCTL